MSEAEWRFLHGVGPEPHFQPPKPEPAPARDPVWVVPDEHLIVVTDTTKNGLDRWDW